MNGTTLRFGLLLAALGPILGCRAGGDACDASTMAANGQCVTANSLSGTWLGLITEAGLMPPQLPDDALYVRLYLSQSSSGAVTGKYEDDEGSEGTVSGTVSSDGALEIEVSVDAADDPFVIAGQMDGLDVTASISWGDGDGESGFLATKQSNSTDPVDPQRPWLGFSTWGYVPPRHVGDVCRMNALIYAFGVPASAVYEIDWGDGTATTTPITGWISHFYPGPGTYPFRLEVHTDAGSASVIRDFTVPEEWSPKADSRHPVNCEGADQIEPFFEKNAGDYPVHCVECFFDDSTDPLPPGGIRGVEHGGEYTFQLRSHPPSSNVELGPAGIVPFVAGAWRFEGIDNDYATVYVDGSNRPHLQGCGTDPDCMLLEIDLQDPQSYVFDLTQGGHSVCCFAP